jgi:hypothetical protein
MIVKPLYGHNSQDTALLVPNYPYSFKLRCQIRYWLEDGGKRGYCFVSQTENPKTLRWNAPKKSTYALIAGNMFEDEKGHTQWSCITEYSDAKQALDFAKAFPESSARMNLLAWAIQKAGYCSLRLQGKAYMTINGERRPDSEYEIAELGAELEVWKEVVALTKSESEQNQ